MKNLRTGKLNKLVYKLRWWKARIVKLCSARRYIKEYRKLLSDYGMNIAQDDYYIDPSAYFDNYDYSIITIGEGVTISREVLFLTHDFSVSKGLKLLNAGHGGYILHSIKIGNNCFVGARAILLPGTRIGDNVIIGGGAVVKGTVPENSVVVGNPARVIGNTTEYGRKHFDAGDYIRT